MITTLLVAATLYASPVPVTPLAEQRYCGEPVRLKDGKIRRRRDVLDAFKKAHPCPSSGSVRGACKGWIMDHVIPLACGGCDSVSNLQWLPEEAWRKKSRWERTPGVYCGRMPQ